MKATRILGLVAAAVLVSACDHNSTSAPVPITPDSTPDTPRQLFEDSLLAAGDPWTRAGINFDDLWDAAGNMCELLAIDMPPEMIQDHIGSAVPGVIGPGDARFLLEISASMRCPYETPVF